MIDHFNFYPEYILIATLMMVLIIFFIHRFMRYIRWKKKNHDLDEAFRRAAKRRK